MKYSHKIVIHSENVADPTTGAHTYTHHRTFLVRCTPIFSGHLLVWICFEAKVQKIRTFSCKLWCLHQSFISFFTFFEWWVLIFSRGFTFSFLKLTDSAVMCHTVTRNNCASSRCNICVYGVAPSDHICWQTFMTLDSVYFGQNNAMSAVWL